MNLPLAEINVKLTRRSKQVIFSAIDLVLFAFSIFIAFNLRLEDPKILWWWINQTSHLIVLLFPVKLLFFWLIGIYKPVLKYMGVEFLSVVIVGVCGSSGILALVGVLAKMQLFPRSVFILDAIITLIMVIASRIAVRWLIYFSFIVRKVSQFEQERILIYGAGEAGSQVVQSLTLDKRYKVVAFIDDQAHLIGQLVSGVKVYSIGKIQSLIDKHRISSILLAMPSIGKLKRVEIINQLKPFNVSIKTVPHINEIVSGAVLINEIKPIDIIDLLGRDEVDPLPNLLKKDITGKSVLVTGAGGSIGSELCRQILTLKPLKLLLYELNEFALYNIDIELKDKHPEVEIVPCLASILNQLYLEKTILNHKVDTIYHAAAYKHVPLIESNLTVGVINNVKGTQICIECAINCDVSTFVLISTDKAVRPTNIMGATKRIAELVAQSKSKGTHSTRIGIVRFGNVLDSAGSVVPRFRQQILENKNLTVTHKEIERYFMSIPEAARLVIQAGALSEGGDVFLLDMGEPVKIYDLAVQMIELSGLIVGEDIDIEIKGLRPGEKLFEELYINHNNKEATIHQKIFKAREPYTPWIELRSQLETLFAAANEQKDGLVLDLLKSIVPEFDHHSHSN